MSSNKKSTMRKSLLLWFLLLIFVESCLCLHSGGILEEKGKGIQGLNVSKGEEGMTEESPELDAMQRLSQTGKEGRGGGRGGKGGSSGGNSELVRQPPSKRKSEASLLPLPYPSFMLLLVSLFFFC